MAPYELSMLFFSRMSCAQRSEDKFPSRLAAMESYPLSFSSCLQQVALEDILEEDGKFAAIAVEMQPLMFFRSDGAGWRSSCNGLGSIRDLHFIGLT